jgi:glycerol uptake facilitator-like aquaporin
MWDLSKIALAITMPHSCGSGAGPRGRRTDARSLGPALIVGGTALSQVWLFIVAPLVGGIAGRAVLRSLA